MLIWGKPTDIFRLTGHGWSDFLVHLGSFHRHIDDSRRRVAILLCWRSSNAVGPRPSQATAVSHPVSPSCSSLLVALLGYYGTDWFILHWPNRAHKSQDFLRTPSARRSRRSLRSGYAFAHQEGFGKLITSGKIMRKTGLNFGAKSTSNNLANNNSGSGTSLPHATGIVAADQTDGMCSEMVLDSFVW